MIVIKSGDSGNVAKVDKDNRLHVDSKSNFVEEYAAENGNSYIVHGECHLAAASSGGLLYFLNTDARYDFVITRIYFDAHSLSKPINVLQIKNPTTITGGTDITLTGLVNKNFGSSKQVGATLKISDASSDITYSGGQQYHSFVLQSMGSTMRDMRGTNVLCKNNSILFGWKTLDGTNAVDGEIISISLNFYVREAQ